MAWSSTCAAAEVETLSGRGLLEVIGRNETLQLFEPVDHHLNAAASGGLFLDHHESLAVIRDVVVGDRQVRREGAVPLEDEHRPRCC